ncbi:MAG: LacI family DNA-binding transcriptional regulator [Nakamurella sp.]
MTTGDEHRGPPPGHGSKSTADQAPKVDQLLAARATVVDVARLAGVSGRTVSRVVTGGPNVSPQTRERVMQAVESLQFRPNRLARELRTGSVSTTVGFIVGDLTNPFYAKVAAGAESVLAEWGLTMLLAATGDDPACERRTVGAVIEHRVRALLLVPVGDDHGYLQHERRLGTPIVAVDRPATNADLDSVVFDNRGGAKDGVQSLITAGHRRIAFVGSDATIFTHAERLTGYLRAMDTAEIPIEQRLIRRDAPDSAAAEHAAHQLLDHDEPPTAIFAANNMAALGVLQAMRGRPSTVALVAFDDFDFAATLGVSVVSHDPREMGRTAAGLALSRLADPDRPSTQIVLSTRLIPRGSGETSPSLVTPNRVHSTAAISNKAARANAAVTEPGTDRVGSIDGASG